MDTKKECLGTGWDDTDSTVSNVASVLHVTTEPTASPVNAPTAMTLPPTPAPSYGEDASDACVNVEVGHPYYDGTWYAVEGGYNGHMAYTQNDYGYDFYLYYADYRDPSGQEMKWWMSWRLGGWSYYYFCPNENLFTCSTHWYTRSNEGFQRILGSVTDNECLNEGLPDNRCASYTCLYVTGAGDYNGYYAAS